MDCLFLHCNYCSALPSANVKFYLSNCGHVGCSKCKAAEYVAPKCAKCNRQTNIVEINDKMKDSLKIYFCDVSRESEEALKSVKRTLEFQIKNYQSLISHKNSIIRELSARAKKNVADQSLIDRLQREKETLELECVALTQNDTICIAPKTQGSNLLNITRNLMAGSAVFNMSSSSFLNGMTDESINMNILANETIEMSNVHANLQARSAMYVRKQQIMDTTI